MKMAVVAILVVLCAAPVLAAEYLMNNAGKTVNALHLVFSEPVEITGFGDVLTVVEPTGESTEFTFSGSEVGLWGGQWVRWEPVSAVLISYDWIPIEFTRHIFSHSYKNEIHEFFDEQQLNPELRTLMKSDPRVSIRLVNGTLRLSGIPSRIGDAQTGLATATCFDATAGFEVVVIARFLARQSPVIIEVNSCGPHQDLTLGCRDNGYDLWWCTDPKHHKQATRSPLLTNNLYETVILRLTYTGTTRSVRTSVNNRVIGTGILPTEYREVELRVFVQSGPYGALGMVDVRIDELHIGWGE